MDTSNDERMSDFAGNFVNAAGEMYAEENPNPARAGCFSDLVIRQMAISAKLPDDSVMNHLFECSDCFREYRRALAAARQINLESKRSWRELVKVYTAKMAFAGLSLALLAALILFTYLGIREKESDEIVKTTGTSNVAPPFDNSLNAPPEKKTENNQAEQDLKDTMPDIRSSRSPEKQKPGQTTDYPRNAAEKNKTQKSQNNSLPKDVALNLVLNDAGVLRNAAGQQASQNSPLALPAANVRLNIQLPGGFSDGRYKITIVDAFGQSLTGQDAVMNNGRLVAESLNLRNLKARASKLCLQRNAEIPDCFNIEVVR